SGFVNHPPAGTDKSVTTLESTTYFVQSTDVGFTDPNDTPANNLKAVKVVTLPSASLGTLFDNGVAVTTTTPIPASDLASGLVRFVPVNKVNGAATVVFQVQDDGGTANSGVDTDQSPN